MTDYCTHWLDRIYSWSWSGCCKYHDLAYASGVDRLLADEALRDCVINSSHGWLAAAASIMGGVMFLGVRLFGNRYYRAAQPKH